MSVLAGQLNQRRREFEERRSYLVDLESLAERLRADEQRLRAEIQGAFNGWLAPQADAHQTVCARPLIERHSKLARSVVAIEAQITAANDALALAAQELKRYETALAQRDGGTAMSQRSNRASRRR